MKVKHYTGGPDSEFIKEENIKTDVEIGIMDCGRIKLKANKTFALPNSSGGLVQKASKGIELTSPAHCSKSLMQGEKCFSTMNNDFYLEVSNRKGPMRLFYSGSYSRIEEFTCSKQN